MSVTDEVTPTKRLGYITFRNNARSMYRMREHKTVKLGVQCRCLRLVVSEPYGCWMNVFEQSSLIKVLALGSKVKQDEVPARGLRRSISDFTVKTENDQTRVDILDMYRDKLTHELHASGQTEQVNQAVAEIEHLKAHVKYLEACKRKAVLIEDFETAKTIKRQLDELMPSSEELTAKPPHTTEPV